MASRRRSPHTLSTTLPSAVTEVARDGSRVKDDFVAVEEPLAVTIAFGPCSQRRRETISITMRTPGHDVDLAVGFLFTESIITTASQILGIDCQRDANAVCLELDPELEVDLARLERRGYISSSCGVCGKTSIDAIDAVVATSLDLGTQVPADVIHALPAALRAAQPTFAFTGGLHAAALFDGDGTLLAAREDVGRHNAVDKLIGFELRAGCVPLANRILVVSGRAGFELIQKAAMAGTAIFAAVGAPTSLAVQLAQRFGMTLLGFVRDERFNIYSGSERILI